MYKITFNMISPIAYIDRPVFDSILSYSVYQSLRKITDAKSPAGDEVSEIQIPLKKHPDFPFYLCSYMFSDSSIEGTDSWKKRWHSRHDFIADFGKAKRRVNTGSGEFKSYDMPVVIHSAKNIWFYFDGDVGVVEMYLRDFLGGIGKKAGMGFGWFSSFVIENIETKINYCLARPLPIDFPITKLADFYVEKGLGAWRLPYWMAEHQEDIIIPELV